MTIPIEHVQKMDRIKDLTVSGVFKQGNFVKVYLRDNDRSKQIQGKVGDLVEVEREVAKCSK